MLDSIGTCGLCHEFPELVGYSRKDALDKFFEDNGRLPWGLK